MNKLLLKYYKIVILFSLLLVISYFSITLLYEMQKNQYLRMQTSILDAKYNTNYRYLKVVSNDIYQMYKESKTLISTYEKLSDASQNEQNEMRTNLYNLYKKRYRRLVNMGVEQLHFYLSNNVSFLRMHKHERFGDDLSDILETVVLANKNQSFTEGFEVGRVAHGFRFIYPLFNSKKEYLGSIGASFSSKQLVKIVSNDDFIDIHFLVLKTSVDKKAWDKGMYAKAWESSDYLIEKEIDKSYHQNMPHVNIKNENIVPTIKLKMKMKKAFSLASNTGEKSIVLSFKPILDVHKKEVLACLVTYKYSAYLDTLLMQRLYLSIILYGLLLLLFIFGVFIINFREKLEGMAHYDTLTKLPNRSFFYIEFQQEIQRAKRNKNKLALLFLDLDSFKEVNDTYGHGTGDKLLREVSLRIQECVREVDIVARLGGDEFTVLLVDLTDEQQSLKIAKSVIASLNEVFIINRQNIYIGASIGIAIYPKHGDTISQLIKNADEMMYNVKNNNKNNAQIYNKESL
ncbi:MAG: diguanylate cyclase [Sulfurimonas sp.]|nr:diguanylate cyclase [Sulfurimonas sp.]